MNHPKIAEHHRSKFAYVYLRQSTPGQVGILKNPSHTGMYVFGRYQYRVQISAQGEVRKQMRAVAMPDWRVRLPEHHEGYVTEEEFLANLERLQNNRTNGESTVLSGPAREGLALLQQFIADRPFVLPFQVGGP
jgi:hypothetical protein